MRSNLPNLLKHKRLIAEIVRFRLKKSMVDNRLGFVWWLVDPTLMILIYWFVFTMIRGVERYEPYPIFLGCAIVSWKFFTRCLNNGIKTFNSHGNTMRAVPFPTMAIPIASTIEEAVMFLFGTLALILVAVSLGLGISWFLLQILPLLLIQILMMFGVAMLASCMGGLVYDLSLYTSHATRMAFYLSPALFGLDMLAEKVKNIPFFFETYVVVNPFALLFEGYRAAIWSPHLIPAWWYCILLIHAIIYSYLGYRLYQRLDRQLLKLAAS